MPRHSFSFPSSRLPGIKRMLLKHSESEQDFVMLDSNGYHDPFGRFEWLFAWEAMHLLTSAENSFEALRAFRMRHKDWLFGHLSYALKDQVEQLSSRNPNAYNFAPLRFFVPRHIVYQEGETLFVESHSIQDLEAFQATLARMDAKEYADENLAGVSMQAGTSHEAYLEKIAGLKKHLQYGNIYEVNYCQSFDAKQRIRHPHMLFERLNVLSKAPFAAFYKAGNNYLMCASPERYLQKSGNTVRVQPIKGTAARYADRVQDEHARKSLYSSEKERAENVMIVDLMRNDLSRTAKKGSVQVAELFGIRSFEAVHQMVSTIESELDTRFDLEDLLQTTFPMGSMTGAPKTKAMKIIEAFEGFDRSLFSGAVGYITPEGDCDFNVVIRSFLYNKRNGHLSLRVGSAITILSDAEAEYQECLLKAEKLFAALT